MWTVSGCLITVSWVWLTWSLEYLVYSQGSHSPWKSLNFIKGLESPWNESWNVLNSVQPESQLSLQSTRLWVCELLKFAKKSVCLITIFCWCYCTIRTSSLISGYSTLSILSKCGLNMFHSYKFKLVWPVFLFCWDVSPKVLFTI